MSGHATCPPSAPLRVAPSRSYARHAAPPRSYVRRAVPVLSAHLAATPPRIASRCPSPLHRMQLLAPPPPLATHLASERRRATPPGTTTTTAPPIPQARPPLPLFRPRNVNGRRHATTRWGPKTHLTPYGSGSGSEISPAKSGLPSGFSFYPPRT